MADENSNAEGAPAVTGGLSSKEATSLYVTALLREREGYVRFGKKDRVKAIDEELERVGYLKKAEKTSKEKVEEPVETAVAEPVAEKAIVKRTRRKRAG